MRSLLILMLFLLHGWLLPEVLPAQSETPADRQTVSKTETARDLQTDPAPGGTDTGAVDAEMSAREEQEKQRRKQKVEIGLILTSGIVIVGIFLVVLTLLYGRRTKRQLASGRGPTSPRDELWYLKKSREASPTNAPDAEQEGGSE